MALRKCQSHCLEALNDLFPDNNNHQPNTNSSGIDTDVLSFPLPSPLAYLCESAPTQMHPSHTHAPPSYLSHYHCYTKSVNDHHEPQTYGEASVHTK